MDRGGILCLLTHSATGLSMVYMLTWITVIKATLSIGCAPVLLITSLNPMGTPHLTSLS